MQIEDVTLYAVYTFAAACGIILAEASYLLLARGTETRRTINRRMRLQEKNVNQKEVLVQLRKERGPRRRDALFSDCHAASAAHPVRHDDAAFDIPADHHGNCAVRRDWRRVLSQPAATGHDDGGRADARHTDLLNETLAQEAPQALWRAASRSARPDHPRPQGRSSGPGRRVDGVARDGRPDRHRIRHRVRRGDLRLGPGLGIEKPLRACRTRGPSPVRHRGVDPVDHRRQSARDP